MCYVEHMATVVCSAKEKQMMKQKKIPGLWLKAMNLAEDCSNCPDDGKKSKCAAERTMPGKSLVDGYDIQACRNRIYGSLVKKQTNKGKRNG